MTNLRDPIRKAISDAYYDTRNLGGTMEAAADRAAAKVDALIQVDAAEFVRVLVQRGAEWAAAQDKAFTSGKAALEGEARIAKDTIAWALAKYLDITPTEAMERILEALNEVTA